MPKATAHGRLRGRSRFSDRLKRDDKRQRRRHHCQSQDAIARTVYWWQSGCRLGVQLIGPVDCVDRVLPRILPLRPATVILPWAAFNGERARAMRGCGGAAWIALWNEWDGAEDPRWPA